MSDASRDLTDGVRIASGLARSLYGEVRPLVSKAAELTRDAIEGARQELDGRAPPIPPPPPPDRQGTVPPAGSTPVKKKGPGD